MRSRLTIMALLALCLALFSLGCTKQPRTTADIPRSLSPSYSIAVAPFTQPTSTSQLIVGEIPRDQGRIAPEMLPALDRTLRDVLLEVFSQARADGVRTPQISFMLPTFDYENVAAQLRELYENIYKPGRYQDLWFYWKGKPLMMGYPGRLNQNDPTDKEIFLWHSESEDG